MGLFKKIGDGFNNTVTLLTCSSSVPSYSWNYLGKINFKGCIFFFFEKKKAIFLFPGLVPDISVSVCNYLIVFLNVFQSHCY